MADEGGKAVLEKHLGSILKRPQIGLAMQLSLQQIAQFVPDVLTEDKLRAVNEDLATVS